MAFETRQRSRRMRRAFLLHQIVPMRPYLTRVMADLRMAAMREMAVRRLLARCPRGNDYSDRRTRYDHDRRLQEIRDQIDGFRRELRALGAGIGEIELGEVLFPCQVNDHDALFVWFVDQKRPTHWRFRDETDLRPIPRSWWASEWTRQRIGR